MKHFGGLDIFFANGSCLLLFRSDVKLWCAAGIVGSLVPITDLTAADAANTFRVNVIGVLLGIKNAARVMSANGGRGGSIIATSSVAGIRANAGRACNL